MKVLCIGDLHVQKKNMLIFKKFEFKLLDYIRYNNGYIDAIVLLGDFLHTMDIVHSQCMNMVLGFFKSLKQFNKPVYVIVGNHDYIGPNEILSKNHWMSNICFTDDCCIHIIDTITQVHDLLFMPYVPPGRFNGLLESVNLNEVKYIFCHQEFKGAQFEFSTIKSEKGDTWSEYNPIIISGHIHKKQWLQKNIYYTGTPYQTRFNEDEDKTIALVDTITNHITEVELNLPKLVTVTIDIDKTPCLLQNTFVSDNLYRIVVISSTLTQTQQFVKNQVYKKLKSYTNVSILFKYTKSVVETNTQHRHTIPQHTNFKEILYENIKHNKNMIGIYEELLLNNN